MPICYGGGINSSIVAQRIVSYGVEKITLCSEILKNMELISECASIFGRQSVVVTLKFLEEVIRAVSNRTYQIKNAIEWNKFQAGYN